MSDTENHLIRPAVVQDLPSLAGLLGLLFALEPDFSIDRSKQIAGLQLLLDHPERCLLLVAEVDGAVAGMCSVQTTLSTAEGGEAALLEDLVVSPQYRGRRLGVALLAGIDAWCRQRGINRLQLLADNQNELALEFYRRQGWASTRLVALRRGVARV